MRIALFGLPNQVFHAYLALTEAGHTITVIIPPTPAHQAHQAVCAFAKAQNTPVLFFNQSPLEKPFIQALQSFIPDVIFVCGYDKLIPPEILQIPPLGCINFHPALLPDYRGGNSYFYMLLQGETIAGVTAHYMDEEFDTGDIIYQESFTIEKHETMGSLANKSEQTAAQLAVRIADELVAKKEIPRSPQPEGIFKKAFSVIPERGDTCIQWRSPAYAIERLVRACNPFYGALTTFRGKPFIILQGEIIINTSTNVLPGTIVKCTETELWIMTAHGCFAPTVVQYDNYLIGSIERIITTISPKVGEILLDY